MALTENREAQLPPRARAPAAGNAAQAAEPIQVRANFDPLAVFAPEVRTGADYAQDLQRFFDRRRRRLRR